jgi:hypothetical protein
MTKTLLRFSYPRLSRAGRRTHVVGSQRVWPTIAITVAVVVFLLAYPARVRAEIVCADDVVPFGTAVTATGTAPSCDGSCRAREIKPVCGLVMKICAGQPVPRGYVLDSITSMPGCQCLGHDNDAYVIRYIGPDGPGAVLSSNAEPNAVPGTRRLPFGNPLCLPNVGESWLSGGGSAGIPVTVPSVSSYPGAQATGATGQQEEPFRIGQ